MTALAGFWAFGGAAEPRAACERMLKAQEVYARASPATAAAGDIAMGRRLFALLPEDRFDRAPVSGGGGRWLLCADIRLSGRDELADKLSIRAEEAARMSDAGLLMRALERWEEAALDHLAGDFAFALWDRDRDRLLLARDLIGHRPLHFHRGSGYFAFSSMAKGLHALPDVPHAPDEEAMRRFVALLPESGTRTFFNGIERVPPAHLCVVTRSGVEIRRYWDPSPRPLRLSRAEDYDEAVREGLDRAVAACLRGAETKVAAHLSGGLDSSAVTATAARAIGPAGRVHAFTSVPREGFSDPLPVGRFGDEGPHAAAVAALYPNIDHVLIRTAGASPFAVLDRNAFLYERPVLNLCNMLWSDAINDAARARGLQVLLTGQMGNMTFSYNGFEPLATLLRRGRLLSLATSALRLRRQGIRLVSVAAHTVGPYMPAAAWRAVNRWSGRVSHLSGYTLISPAALADVQSRAAEEGLDLSYRPSRNSFATRVRVLGRLDPGNYYKGTLAGWGIDTRDPTAERNLIELCLSIPDEQYLRGGRMRALARDAFADRLPPQIINESRKGLQAVDWYDGVTAARAAAADEADRIAALAPAQAIFDVERMRRLVAEWPQGEWNSFAVQATHRIALLRGISGGHFLRKALGAN